MAKMKVIAAAMKCNDIIIALLILFDFEPFWILHSISKRSRSQIHVLLAILHPT